MEKVVLGKTSFKITKLGFGTLPMGPLQLNVPKKYGEELIRYALKKGINFIDTAHIYKTYKYIRKPLKEASQKVYISSKTTARDYKGTVQEINFALNELGIDFIDIFLLHAARTKNPFEGRTGAWQALQDYKNKGLIKAIGVASHSVLGLQEALKKGGVDVLHPLFNLTGMGIIHGRRDEMVKLLKQAHKKKIGIYIMKPLAGGNLIKEREKALSYVLNQSFIDGIMLGMVRKEEVDYNVKFFTQKKIPQKLANATAESSKRISIISFCKKCGECIKACPNKALRMGKNKPIVRYSRCLLCGYCAGACKEFFIRLV
jgi:aryl-alcohol dehydrogenase-like predicted oxidoreductase